MDLVRSDDLSLKYQRFTSSGCKDNGIRKFEFVAIYSVYNFTKDAITSEYFDIRNTATYEFFL